MRILLCHSILEREIEPLLKYFSKGDVKKYSNKASKGLGTQIKGSQHPGTKLIKVNMTSKSGAGRMIVLLYMRKDFAIPLIVRLKKDKIVGQNASIANPSFQSLVEKNISLVEKDLEKGKFEELT